MPLVQSLQYIYAHEQPTYHLVERGEKPFSELSNPDLNRQKYIAAKCNENVGHSFEDIFDDLIQDEFQPHSSGFNNAELYHRHILPQYQQASNKRDDLVLARGDAQCVRDARMPRGRKCKRC